MMHALYRFFIFVVLVSYGRLLCLEPRPHLLQNSIRGLKGIHSNLGSHKMPVQSALSERRHRRPASLRASRAELS